METEFFPHFIRMNYPSMGNEKNVLLIAFGEEFKTYLENKFEGQMEKLAPIWDINPKTVIMKVGHPFRHNGYHPALLLHFTDFISQMVEENG